MCPKSPVWDVDPDRPSLFLPLLVAGCGSIPKWIHKSLWYLCLNSLFLKQIHPFQTQTHWEFPAYSSLIGWLARIWRECTVHQELRRLEFFLLCWEDSISLPCLLDAKDIYLYATDSMTYWNLFVVYLSVVNRWTQSLECYLQRSCDPVLFKLKQVVSS